MYDVIYDQMVDAKIAIRLEKKIYCDRDGEIVDKEKSFGSAIDCKVTHTNYLLFADETGCNTSQKKDGQEGNEKRVVAKGTVAQSVCSATECKYTLLPFTSASGEAVCCVVIFDHPNGEVPINWATGIDIRKEPKLDSMIYHKGQAMKTKRLDWPRHESGLFFVYHLDLPRRGDDCMQLR